MRSFRLLTAAGVAALLSQLPASVSSVLPREKSSLPVVDLGYELHQAAFFNETGAFYNFSNIRYAAPPVGKLRFAAPQLPSINRSEIQTGSVGRICPQANPAWEAIAAVFVPDYLAGIPFNLSSFSTGSNTTVSIPPQDPRTTEDCLFLDVVVPQKVFENAYKGSGAPVMVWIYGGGYTDGEKSSSSAAGLVAASQKNSKSSEGIIFVSLNYRLGAFGWLSGPTLQKEGGTANNGLRDQRMALEWVQKHIAAFGGDPKRVTLFGESAGGGSVMHQITAFGSKSPAPFQQAIPQSPGWLPLTSRTQQESIFQTYLSLLNVSTLEQARQLPSEAVMLANIIQVGLDSPYGTFTYGPAVDGDFAPKLPGQLLLEGKFDHSLKIMVGHNVDEGLIFTSPAIANDSDFKVFLSENLPDANASLINFIAEDLYPPVFSPSTYKDETARAALLSSEFIFTCNTNYLDRAFNNQTFAYLFAVPPGIHGEDVPYTFFNGPAAGIDVEIAAVQQGILTSFAETGTPSVPAGLGPKVEMYGPDARILDLNITGVSEVMDPAAVSRCLFWQTAPYETPGDTVTRY